MTNVTISPNRLTSSGKLDSSADVGGGLRPILLGRLDISMVADDIDLKGSIATSAQWTFDHQNSTIKKYTELGQSFIRSVYNNDLSINAGSWPSSYFYFQSGIAPQEFYVQLYARRDGAILANSKFMKMYDPNNGGANYSNVTWNAGYSTASIGAVSFGNGTGQTNDTQHVIGYANHSDVNLRYPSVPANVLPASFIHTSGWDATEWGDGSQWHKWQFRIKANTGTSVETEINDGIFEVWVDGIQRLGAYNIMNRHYGSAPFSKIEFLSYSQGRPSFTLDMKNITISTGGWID